MKRVDLLSSLDIGSTIKKLREKKGLSQEKLAENICDRSNLTKIENSKTKIPSLNFILLICEKLEITIDEFLNYATNNIYSLDRKLILKHLLDDNYQELNAYLESLDVNFLNNKDQQYYKYLRAIISNNPDYKKEQLLEILKNEKAYSYKQYYDLLAIHELIKSNLSTLSKQIIDQIYSDETYKKLINAKTPIEVLYFINDCLEREIKMHNLNRAKFLLSIEIEFINTHNCYSYISTYYKNKIKVYKDDANLISDAKSKLKAINKKT